MQSPTSPSDAVHPPKASELAEHPPPYLFGPLFALIRDANSGEYYHPSTHYVFVDDDADAMSAAAFHSLDLYSADNPDTHATRAMASESEIEERYIVVDLVPDAQGTTLEVKGSTCLNPRWAVADAKVRPAPVFGAGDDDTGGNMMLVVEGAGVGQDATSKRGKATKGEKADHLLHDARERCGGSITAGMGDIYASLRSGLGILDKVVDPHRPPDPQV